MPAAKCHSGPPVTWKYDHTRSPSSDHNTSTAAIADVNGDGLDEILVTGGHRTPEHGREESLLVLSRDGVCLSRLTLAYGGSCDTPPIVCDPTGRLLLTCPARTAA